jgi:hypothetical protein
MKLLKKLHDSYGCLPTTPSVRQFLEKQRDSMGARDFCGHFFNHFCSRPEGEFVDYGLLALKLKAHLEINYPYGDFEYEAPRERRGHEDLLQDLVSDLLWDDRHDCYQNVLPNLEEFLTINSNKIDKFFSFWEEIAEILISCFNTEGTKDVIWKKDLL